MDDTVDGRCAVDGFCFTRSVRYGFADPPPAGAAADYGGIRTAGWGLKGAAEQLRVTGLTGEKARAILNNLCGDFSYAVDCTAVDARDRMVAVEPVPFRYLEGSDISWQEQVIGVQKSRKPVPSAVFRSVEGFDAADAEYPVIAPDGRFIGSVSLLFKPETFLENILHPLVRGLPVDIWVMEPGGRILFDSDRSQVGLNLFTSLRY